MSVAKEAGKSEVLSEKAVTEEVNMAVQRIVSLDTQIIGTKTHGTTDDTTAQVSATKTTRIGTQFAAVLDLERIRNPLIDPPPLDK